MINAAFSVLKAQLDEYLEAQTGMADIIELKLMADSSGAPGVTSGKIGMNLVHLEEERTMKEHPSWVPIGNGNVARLNPELKLNLYLLFGANFSMYTNSLTNISHVISFFQNRPVFDRQNSPSLDERIRKLILELYTPSFEQMNHIWSTVGAKYLPSVMYKMRMLIIQEELIQDNAPPIQYIRTDSAGS